MTYHILNLGIVLVIVVLVIVEGKVHVVPFVVVVLALAVCRDCRHGDAAPLFCLVLVVLEGL